MMAEQAVRTKLGSQELTEVLECYDLGMVTEIRAYERGSRRSPKAWIRAIGSKYLLKRRAPGRDDADRIRFQHAVQIHLESHGCQIAGLVKTRSGETQVLRGSRVYELFHFIEGERFNSQIGQLEAAGTAMSRMHDECAVWMGPVHGGVPFHASQDVETAMTHIRENGDPELISAAAPLQDMFETAREQVMNLGWSSMRNTIVHGDWHPGNLLFVRDEVAALLDFDSTRAEPRIAEFANGGFQFAMRHGAGSSGRLSGEPSLDALSAIRRGYDAGTFEPLEEEERAMVPPLMIEAMIVEGIVPVAMHGSFGDVQGNRFLSQVRDTADWIASNRDDILNALNVAGAPS
jgi:Ser/Thr protein kinase RdoA (MazF antagonist)